MMRQDARRREADLTPGRRDDADVGGGGEVKPEQMTAFQILGQDGILWMKVDNSELPKNMILRHEIAP